MKRRTIQLFMRIKKMRGIRLALYPLCELVSILFIALL